MRTGDGFGNNKLRPGRTRVAGGHGGRPRCRREVLYRVVRLGEPGGRRGTRPLHLVLQEREVRRGPAGGGRAWSSRLADLLRRGRRRRRGEKGGASRRDAGSP